MDTEKRNVIQFPGSDTKAVDVIREPEDASTETAEGPEFGDAFVSNPDELTQEQKNVIFLTTVGQRIQLEVKAIKRFAHDKGYGTTFIEDDLEDLGMTMLEMATNRNIKGYNGKFDISMIISHYLEGLHGIFGGQIMAPIYGTDEEWQDLDKSTMIGQTLTIPFRGQEVEIQIESVQVNKRLTSIFRFNNDNRYMHRRDMFQFVDVDNKGHVLITDESVRYITAPYTGEVAICRVHAEDGKVTRYEDFSQDEIQNEIVFSNIAENMKDPYAHVVASPIPVFMLEQFGISIEEEERKYEEDVQKLMNEIAKHKDDDPNPDPDSEGEIDTDAIDDET